MTKPNPRRCFAVALALGAALWALALQGCDTQTEYHYPEALLPAPVCGQGASLTALAKDIAQTSFAFGLTLAQTAGTADTQGNILISPTSIATALTMTWNGAAGETEQQMRSVLRFGDLSADEIRQGYRDLLSYLACTNPEVALEYANAIWYRADLESKLIPEFSSQSADSFFAPIAPIPDEDAVGYINGWISQRTHDKIQDLIQEIDPNVAMLLVNALYFKANWKTEFKTLSENGSFNAPDGAKDIAYLGHGEPITYPYAETLTYQAVRIEYKGDSHAMTIILPRENQTADAVLASFTPETLVSLQQTMAPATVKLLIPRFKVEYGTFLLNDSLQALGMVSPFDPNAADFSKIFNNNPVFISKVMHKAFVAVTEKGTEAAAATVVEMQDSATPGDDAILMSVNRPFVFLIHDTAANTLLFLGKIVNPQRIEAN